MHAIGSQDTFTRKKDINVTCNHEKDGVDSYDKMCALYTAAKKTNRWPVWVFYGNMDNSALNVFVIFIHNLLGFGEDREKTTKIIGRNANIVDYSSS